MMNATDRQRKFRFTLPHVSGSRRARQLEEEIINKGTNPTKSTKTFNDLLKRIAMVAMQDATDCEPVTIGAHVARLRDLETILKCVIAHPELCDPGETLPSGHALSHPSTLEDYRAAVNVTRLQHRSPAFLNKFASDFEALHDKIDLIASLICRLRRGETMNEPDNRT